jgi:hypothetical protein
MTVDLSIVYPWFIEIWRWAKTGDTGKGREGEKEAPVTHVLGRGSYFENLRVCRAFWHENDET